MKKLRVAAALSCFMTLGTIVGPLGSGSALADECSPVEVDVPSLSIDLTPQSRTVRRGRTASVGVRVTRVEESPRGSRVVPADNVDVLFVLEAGNTFVVDGTRTDDRGNATLKFRIPTSFRTGKADANSKAQREVKRAGCVVVSERGEIDLPDFLRIRA